MRTNWSDLKTMIETDIHIKIDKKVALRMLRLGGFVRVDETPSDEDIIKLVMECAELYGLSYEERCK